MATKATQTHFRGIRLSSQEIAILAKRPIGCTDSVNRLEGYVLEVTAAEDRLNFQRYSRRPAAR